VEGGGSEARERRREASQIHCPRQIANSDRDELVWLIVELLVRKTGSKASLQVLRHTCGARGWWCNIGQKLKWTSDPIRPATSIFNDEHDRWAVVHNREVVCDALLFSETVSCAIHSLLQVWPNCFSTTSTGSTGCQLQLCPIGTVYSPANFGLNCSSLQMCNCVSVLPTTQGRQSALTRPWRPSYGAFAMRVPPSGLTGFR
jgi:hypothetical protein